MINIKKVLLKTTLLLLIIVSFFTTTNNVFAFSDGTLDISFKSYYFGEPKISEKEARENNTTFDAPLYANVELINKVTG